MNFKSANRFPVYGWFGILLIAVFWFLNWNLSGLRTQWGFFPLWLGYCLTVDAVVFLKKNTSLLTRNYKAYIGLFLISAPTWWLFELLNGFTHNWYYDGRQYFTNLEYAILATISFSIVIPAVFGTAEFVSTFKWVKKFNRGPRLRTSKRTLAILLLIGVLLLILIITFPALFYPFIWLTIYLIVDPFNVILKNRSLLQYTSSPDWRPVITLSTAALICGFFWEMWNYFSYPKWIYFLPHVNFFHIFEMPILGYIGYIFFPFELFAIYNLIMGIFFKNKLNNYVHVLPE